MHLLFSIKEEEDGGGTITVEDIPCESYFSIAYFKKKSSSIFFSFPTDFVLSIKYWALGHAQGGERSLPRCAPAHIQYTGPY